MLNIIKFVSMLMVSMLMVFMPMMFSSKLILSHPFINRRIILICQSFVMVMLMMMSIFLLKSMSMHITHFLFFIITYIILSYIIMLMFNIIY